MKLKDRFLTTGIGSLPYIDAVESAEMVCKDFDIPFWPQLPRRGFNENMYTQFSQGLPGLVIDEKNRRIHMRGSGDLSEELARVHEAYISKDYNSFGITDEFAKGFYEFIKAAKRHKPQYAKGHVTGPVSFGLGIVDEKERPVMYNDEIREAFVRLLGMKAMWQIDRLRDIAREVIVFIDEPYLTSFGSGFVNIQRQDIVSMLNAIISDIHSKLAIAGVHCCGNTDWSILTDTDVDIINFDAYSYAGNVLLYYQDIFNFLKKGGYLAWGIVPTSESVLKETDKALFERLSLEIENLDKKSIPKELVASNSILTPSCGMGTLSENLTEDIIKKLIGVARLARRTFPKI